MFKFFKKLKKRGKEEIDPAMEFPDFTAQQLVQRFHSESALCDPSHRRVLLEAAEETHAQIELRQTTINVKEAAAASCRQLSDLQSSVTDLRTAQWEQEARAKRMKDHIAVHNAPLPELQKLTVENEKKMVSLVAMTDMIQQAAVTVEEDLRASAQKRARSRSKARLRDSLESKSGFMGGLECEPSASCMEFGRARYSTDAEKPLAELVRESNEYIDENACTWAQIDSDALYKELEDVKVLLELYEESTRKREERLVLAEQHNSEPV